jgi:hypothetical protein
MMGLWIQSLGSGTRLMTVYSEDQARIFDRRFADAGTERWDLVGWVQWQL